MEISPNLLHDLKPEELSKVVALSKETNKSISILILEAARELAARNLASQDNSGPEDKTE
jgi:hypothetical protein